MSKTYTVKSGDTLSKIAVKHNIALDEIVKANKIINPNLIYKGQVLIIPDATTQDVKKAVADCVSAVAKLPEFKTLCDLMGW